MKIVPVINVTTYDEALAQVKTALDLIKDNDGWIHIDVSDGKFTSATTPWATPDAFKKLAASDELLNPDSFAIHLMVENPAEVLKNWIDAGAKWFVVHEEAIKDFDAIKDIAVGNNVEIALSIKLDGELNEKTKLFNIFQVLAVKPGFSGQEFDIRALDKIKLLRGAFPNAKIEVDGGINPKTAKLVKDAGADIAVSASYIFGSDDPKKAYYELQSI